MLFQHIFFVILHAFGKQEREDERDIHYNSIGKTDT